MRDVVVGEHKRKQRVTDKGLHRNGGQKKKNPDLLDQTDFPAPQKKEGNCVFRGSSHKRIV